MTGLVICRYKSVHRYFRDSVVIAPSSASYRTTCVVQLFHSTSTCILLNSFVVCLFLICIVVASSKRSDSGERRKIPEGTDSGR